MQLVNIFQPYMINNLDYTLTFRDADGLRKNTGFEPERILSVLQTAAFRNVAAVKWDTATDIRGLLLTALGDARSVDALLAEELETQP